MLFAAGRSGQLQRGFDILGRMQQAGAQPDEITFTCLIEGCVLARESDMALKWFRKAVSMGICKSLQVGWRAKVFGGIGHEGVRVGGFGRGDVHGLSSGEQGCEDIDRQELKSKLVEGGGCWAVGDNGLGVTRVGRRGVQGL